MTLICRLRESCPPRGDSSSVSSHIFRSNLCLPSSERSYCQRRTLARKRTLGIWHYVSKQVRHSYSERPECLSLGVRCVHDYDGSIRLHSYLFFCFKFSGRERERARHRPFVRLLIHSSVRSFVRLGSLVDDFVSSEPTDLVL